MYISRIHYDQQKLHGVHLETLRRNDPVRTENKSTSHIQCCWSQDGDLACSQ